MKKCSSLGSPEPGIKDWIHLSREPWFHLRTALFVLLIPNVQPEKDVIGKQCFLFIAPINSSEGGDHR